MAQMRPRLVLVVGPMSLLAGFCLFWFADTIADPDLWGHVRFGQDILRTGAIAQTDTYSYRTGGQPWINHEWLSEVIFAFLYDRFGSFGLIVFKVLVSLAIFGLCYGHLRSRALGPWGSVFLLVLISIPFRMGLGTIRPQIFTYLLFLIELLLLDRAAGGRAVRLWALPILMTTWVNLHGGVLAGIGVLGLWIVVGIIMRLRDRASPRRGRLAMIAQRVWLGMACGLVLLLNPYGARLPVFLLRTGLVPRPEIHEWTPLDWMGLPGYLVLVLVAIGLIGVIGSRRHRRPESLLILGVTAILPFFSNRHYPLFAMTLVVLGGEHIADVGNRWRLSESPARRLGQGFAAISLIVAPILIGLALPRFGCIRIEPFYFKFPARAVTLLKHGGLRGNMAVPFDWGEYVIWHLGPAVKVSIDGRRETVYSDGSYQQSREFAEGTKSWDALLMTGPPTDLVLLPNGSPAVPLLSRMTGWLPLYQDRTCVIFTRAGLPGLDRIVQTPVPALPDDGDQLCFPAPGSARSATR